MWKVRLGEHGRHGAAGKPASAPRQERSHATKVNTGRSRRWGPLTAETAIVLCVAAAIVGGAFLMDNLRPGGSTTNVINGKDTIVEHQLGKGGIKPGDLQPRTIVPEKPVVASPTAPTALLTATAKPSKTPKPTKAPTVAPTTPTSGGGLPIPGGGNNGGGSGGGGETCTPIPLIKTCPPKSEESPAPSDDGPPEGTPATEAPGTDTDNSGGSSSKGSSKGDGKSSAQQKKPATPAPDGR